MKLLIIHSKSSPPSICRQCRDRPQRRRKRTRPSSRWHAST